MPQGRYVHAGNTGKRRRQMSQAEEHACCGGLLSLLHACSIVESTGPALLYTLLLFKITLTALSNMALTLNTLFSVIDDVLYREQRTLYRYKAIVRIKVVGSI